MAIIEQGGKPRRPFSLRGIVNLYLRGGKTFARAWPKKRGKSPYPWQRAAITRHLVFQKALKLLPWVSREPLETALNDWLRENKGVRGTAAIRLRDWLTQILSGRMWAFTLPDGRILYSAAVVRDCSDLLDLLEPRIGSMMVRTPDTWLPTVNCHPKSVLTIMIDGQISVCCPDASIPPKHLAIGGY